MMELNVVMSLMSALAQPTRYQCLSHLVGHGQCTAGDLAVALGVPANTMSSHLTILAHAGLVTSVRSGRNIIYSAKVTQVTALIDKLTDLVDLADGET